MPETTPARPSLQAKHPISHGQPTRDTTCWREHTEGYVCLLAEGHEVLDEAADLRERLLQWVAACGCFCQEDRQRDSLDEHEMQCPAWVEHLVRKGSQPATSSNDARGD